MMTTSMTISVTSSDCVSRLLIGVEHRCPSLQWALDSVRVGLGFTSTSQLDHMARLGLMVQRCPRLLM